MFLKAVKNALNNSAGYINILLKRISTYLKLFVSIRTPRAIRIRPETNSITLKYFFMVVKIAGLRL